MEPELLGLHWVWVILAAFGVLLGIGLGILLMVPVRPEQAEGTLGPWVKGSSLTSRPRAAGRESKKAA